MILSYFFLILKSFPFVICWPNSEASPHEQNIYWDFSKHQYFTGVKNIKQQNQGAKMLQKILHFVYFCLPVCEVWLPKDYVFWLSGLYQRAAPIPYSRLCNFERVYSRGPFLSIQSLYQRAAPIPYPTPGSHWSCTQRSSCANMHRLWTSCKKYYRPLRYYTWINWFCSRSALSLKAISVTWTQVWQHIYLQ